jgi:hypothetical protein
VAGFALFGARGTRFIQIDLDVEMNVRISFERGCFSRLTFVPIICYCLPISIYPVCEWSRNSDFSCVNIHVAEKAVLKKQLVDPMIA